MTDEDPAVSRKSPRLSLIDAAAVAVVAGIVGLFLYVALSSINW